VFAAVWFLVLADDSLLCHALETPADTASPAVAQQAQPSKNVDFAVLLDQATQHVCSQNKDGLFCALSKTLKPTFQKKSRTDFVRVLHQMNTHFCSGDAAKAGDGCKLFGLLATAVPPTMVRVQAQLDQSPLVVIDDKVDVDGLGLNEQFVYTDAEQEYIRTVQKVSRHICKGGPKTLLCDVGKGLETHYRQACKSGDNSVYISFLKQTESYYCQKGSSGKGGGACQMFPELLKGVPAPHPADRGTVKILAFLKMIDSSVQWYCNNAQGSGTEPSLFCHLSTGLKQTYLESIKQHNPHSFEKYVAKIRAEYCSTPVEQSHNRCKIYALLEKGMPDLVHQDLDVKGLSQLPPLDEEPQGDPAARAKLQRDVIRKIRQEQDRPDMGEAVTTDYASYYKAVSMMEAHFCKTTDDVLCSQVHMLKRSLKIDIAEKDLTSFHGALKNVQSSFCTKDATSIRCHALTLLLDYYPKPKADNAGTATVVPAAGVTVKVDQKTVGNKQVSVSVNGGPAVPVMTNKNLPDRKLAQHVNDLQKMSCGKQISDPVFCQMTKGLAQVYHKSAQSPAFFKLLSQLKEHYCSAQKQESTKACSTMVMMSTHNSRS
jgi:hypothetical protein